MDFTRAIDQMSDDDLWHIASVITGLCGGSLLDVTMDEVVTEIRASFEDPDTGRKMRNARTPLGGLPNKKIEFCRCVTTTVIEGTVQDCGCAFGQCAKGMIY